MVQIESWVELYVWICADKIYHSDGEFDSLEVQSIDFDYHMQPHEKADVVVALATVRGSSFALA